jgi:hypothetical protein
MRLSAIAANLVELRRLGASCWQGTRTTVFLASMSEPVARARWHDRCITARMSPTPRTQLVAMIVGLLWQAASCTVTERGIEAPASPAESVRVEGRVSHVDELPSPDEQLRQVAVVTLHTDGKPVRVELAPRWFLEANGLKYAPEQTLFVHGERTDTHGEPRIVAREVEQGGVRVRLRDEQGRPVWNDTPPLQDTPRSGSGGGQTTGVEHGN